MTATKLKLTPEAVERKRTESLVADLRELANLGARINMFLNSPTDHELDVIADACNEILNGIDEWLDDREDARFAAGSKARREEDRLNVKKRARGPSKKKRRSL